MANKNQILPLPVAVSLFATLGICAFGGASRNDVLSQIVVQFTAAGLIAFALVQRASWAALPKAPVLILGAILLIIAAQIVPLPPTLWHMLPGRDLITQIDAATALSETWRPISLVPDSTLSALLGLIAPISALVAFALIPRDRWHMLILTLLSLTLTSAIIGLLQVAAPSSGLYFYKVSNVGSPVGIFANRNHQAIFLALSPVLLMTLHLGWQTRLAQHKLFQPALLSIFLLCLVAALVNGSRIGLVAFALGLLGACALHLSFPRRAIEAAKERSRRAKRNARLKLGIVTASILTAAGAVLLSSRSLESVNRFSETTLSGEGRLKLTRPLLEIAGSYFPVGTGVGTFPEVYKIHEPDEYLTLSYLNHAHNEFIESIIESGAAALVLAACAFCWFVLVATRSWRAWGSAFTRGKLYARASTVMLLVLFIGCATDYPLRTPALGYIAVLALLWLSALPRAPSARTGEEQPG